MSRLPLTLLVILALASCSPATDGPWTGGGKTLRGVRVAYQLIEVNGPVTSSMTFGANRCDIEVRMNTLIDRLSPSFLAEQVAHCFHEVLLGSKYLSDLDRLAIYLRGYVDAYIATCGQRYQPLGWGGIEDGDCRIPDPRDF